MQSTKVESWVSKHLSQLLVQLTDIQKNQILSRALEDLRARQIAGGTLSEIIEALTYAISTQDITPCPPQMKAVCGGTLYLQTPHLLVP